MELYHKDIYLPEGIAEECHNLYNGNLKYTKHFNERIKCFADKLSLEQFEDIVEKIKIFNPLPFEVAVEDGKPIKCCVRFTFNKSEDICIVFGNHTVITFWFNDVNDNHYTLERDRYCQV